MTASDCLGLKGRGRHERWQQAGSETEFQVAGKGQPALSSSEDAVPILQSNCNGRFREWLAGSASECNG
jgi:hypothetical protein